jgi:hypothetical protein
MVIKEGRKMSEYHYETFEDWFEELEKYSYRSERYYETLAMYKKKEIPAKALEWLMAAFECGRMKKGEE